MTSHKVIWIDDEYEKQDAMLDTAYKTHNIELVPFKTSKSGMAELEKNLALYDAVILDAKVFNESEDEVAKTTGMHSSIHKLIELSSKKYVPYLIFTGQKDLDTDSSFNDSIPDGIKVFKKAIENSKMFEYLKEEITNSPLTELKRNYKAAFEVCTDKYIGEDYQKTLLQILASINKPLEQFDDELYFTQIRIMLEAMFRKANEIGLLHDKCLPGGKVNLTESGLFLSGEPTLHLKVQCAIPHFSKIVSAAVQSIITITGAASHTTTADTKNNVNLQEYRKTVNSPYLLYNLSFQLMDILIWFKNYMDSNTDVTKNKSHWLDGNQGTISRITPAGSGIFQPNGYGNTISVSQKMMTDNNLKVGDKIEVEVKTIEIIRTLNKI